MTYELAKELKDAGFPQRGHGNVYLRADGNSFIGTEDTIGDACYLPTLSELIEACGTLYFSLETDALKYEATPQQWEAKASGKVGTGSTPEEAVANLWLITRNKNGQDIERT